MTQLTKYPLLAYTDYENIGHILPVFKKFISENKELLYCGVNHTFDPENPLFKQLKQELLNFHPNLILLEGGTKINPNHPKRINYFDKIKTQSYDDLIVSNGEFGFALKFALENNIEVFCPEPEFIQQINFLLEKYSRNEIFVNQVLKMAVQFYTMADGTEIKDYLVEEIEWQEEELKKESTWLDFIFTWENFLNLFEFQFNKQFLDSNSDFINEINDPIPWSSKIYKWTINNQITQDECKFKDNFILNIVQQKSTFYNKIFVVYGGSHYYAQAKSLKLIYDI